MSQHQCCANDRFCLVVARTRCKYWSLMMCLCQSKRDDSVRKGMSGPLAEVCQHSASIAQHIASADIERRTIIAAHITVCVSLEHGIEQKPLQPIEPLAFTACRAAQRLGGAMISFDMCSSVIVTMVDVSAQAHYPHVCTSAYA